MKFGKLFLCLHIATFVVYSQEETLFPGSVSHPFQTTSSTSLRTQKNRKRDDINQDFHPYLKKDEEKGKTTPLKPLSQIDDFNYSLGSIIE